MTAACNSLAAAVKSGVGGEREKLANLDHGETIRSSLRSAKRTAG